LRAQRMLDLLQRASTAGTWLSAPIAIG